MKKYVDGVLVDLTDNEIKARQKEETDWAANANTRLAEQHRLTRNNSLAETDWMASSDLTMSNEWKTYRQSLRDITKNSNWPNLKDADWPTKPS